MNGIIDVPKSIYIDMPQWKEPVKSDDFLVAIGKRQSNSVYHVCESRPSKNKKKRMIRYYLKVYKSDLITALKRESNQILIPVYWYSRNKK